MQPANRSLKLADYSKPLTRSPGALFFERRHSPRHRLRGRATALVSDPAPRHDHHRICPLELRDQSATGLGAIGDAPVEIGRAITVYFPPHGPEHGCDLAGTVVRCRKQDGRYDIGISLTQRLAA